MNKLTKVYKVSAFHVEGVQKVNHLVSIKYFVPINMCLLKYLGPAA